ncbi:hypothetical protein [Chryseobacterium sp. MMS23-Vi53]|uniref:hypothetical protein n=1 Tax=Chryseobacterium sp. MMS23-Vi53 TaxID=3386644 RepID=UPI0039E7F20A
MSRKVFYILFFLQSIFPYSQQITIINNIEEPFDVKYFSKVVTLKKKEKQIISGEGKLNSIIINNHRLNLYLEPSEKLDISVAKDGLRYKGDKDSIYSLIAKIHLINYSKIKEYQQIIEKNNPQQYINNSELTLSDDLKKVDDFWNFDKSTKSYKRLREYVIYNWLTTCTLGLFPGTTGFQKDVVDNYYKKYIEKDIQTFQCDSTFKYAVIEYLAQNKKKLGINLPTYPIIMASHDDEILQYFPTSCQQNYFESKYQFLKSKKDSRQDIFKKALKEKFHHNVD